MGIGLFYYAFSIPEPEGLSLADWPNRFTENFSIWMENEDGAIAIKDIGLERLDEYGLWLQVVDESGQEVFSHNKPTDYPSNYSASELVELAASGYENGNTVYTVEGRLAWGHRLIIYNAYQEQLGEIKEEVFTFLPRFRMYMNDACIGYIEKEFSFFRPKFHLSCNDWTIHGNFME